MMRDGQAVPIRGMRGRTAPAARETPDSEKPG